MNVLEHIYICYIGFLRFFAGTCINYFQQGIMKTKLLFLKN